MPFPRPLSRDPIQEAVFDFRASGTAITSGAEFEKVGSLLSTSFPKLEVRRKLATKIEFNEGKLVTTNEDEGFFGLFLKSDDDQTIAQFRPNGFTLNRLKPYTGWDSLLPRVLELWDTYVSIAKPEHVSRIALRYINRLDVPVGQGADFSTYLRAAPEVPAELPQAVSGFHTVVTIVDQDQGTMANISQQLLQSSPLAIMLDIDAYSNGPFSADRESIKPVLERLRDFKNRIFFESLTETTLRLYE
jgi:uncharacterized protein (TIGR04255 family)